MKVVKIGLSIGGVCAVLWGASILFARQYVSWTYDERLAEIVPESGSEVINFREGMAITRYADYGLNACCPFQKDGKFVLLHGDSYVEAFQLDDDKKPDAVLAHEIGNGVRVHGIGRSGAGLPSMILRAQSYERTLGMPAVHVFLVASGIRNDLFEDTGGAVRIETGYAKPATSGFSCRVAKVRNLLHLNFITTFNKVLKDIHGRFGSHNVQAPQNIAHNVEEEARFVLLFMRRSLKSPCAIVYCPNLPRIVGRGSKTRLDRGVDSSDPDCDDAKTLRRVAEAEGVSFIDATPALMDCLKTEGTFPRGFSNLGSPGEGHLNIASVRYVFSYVAQKLKERYGL